MRKSISKKTRAIVHSKYDGRCAYCGKELGTRWHVDHIQPLSRGGSDDIGNMNPACIRCNLRKGGLTVEEFREEIGAQAIRLRRDSAAFRLAEDFGAVEAREPAQFCFEYTPKAVA